MPDYRIHSFAPLFAKDARILILGSMPSVKSLENSFYYAHPRNAFWPILSDIFTAPIDTIAEKRHLVEMHALALWDVAESCIRKGSLDSAMRDIFPNDIAAFVHSVPIERILLNGQTAFHLFRRHFPALMETLDCRLLPSTSPAHTMPYPVKFTAWKNALDGIDS